MATKIHSNLGPAKPVIAGVLVFIAIAGFSGWLATGNDVFMALLQNGMSWCF